MHLRGRAMAMEAILPNGKTMVLSHVNNFNFNWHVNYVYTSDAAPLLPKGTILRITAWYDNTSANKNNPDPNQWVGYGDRTVDEMGHAWVNITYMSDADYQAELAKHKDTDAGSLLTAAAKVVTTTRKLRLRLAAVAIAGWALLAAQESRAQLPLEPIRDSGQGVTGAFEGWYPNADGSFTLLVGYFNRNEKSDA